MTARGDALRADLRALVDEWEAAQRYNREHMGELLRDTPLPADFRAVLDAHEPAAENDAPRTTVAEAIAAWEANGPTSLTVALVVDALYGVRDVCDHVEADR